MWFFVINTEVNVLLNILIICISKSLGLLSKFFVFADVFLSLLFSLLFAQCCLHNVIFLVFFICFFVNIFHYWIQLCLISKQIIMCLIVFHLYVPDTLEFILLYSAYSWLLLIYIYIFLSFYLVLLFILHIVYVVFCLHWCFENVTMILN